MSCLKSRFPAGVSRPARRRVDPVFADIGKYQFDTVEECPRILGVDIDITNDVLRTQEIETARVQMEYDSRHDALTGLANRRLLDETFTAAMEGQTFSPHSIMHIDVDLFKQINDTLGHQAGDLVLQHISSIVQRCAEDQGLVARVGGDEIAIFFPALADTSALRSIAQDILTAVAEPFDIGGVRCDLGVSIGIAIVTHPSSNPSRVFVEADQALYAAKKAGRKRVSIFTRQGDIQQ